MRTEYAELQISADLARQIVEVLDEEGDNAVHLRSSRVFESEEPVEDEVYWEQVEFSTFQDDAYEVVERWREDH